MHSCPTGSHQHNKLIPTFWLVATLIIVTFCGGVLWLLGRRRRGARERSTAPTSTVWTVQEWYAVMLFGTKKIWIFVYVTSVGMDYPSLFSSRLSSLSPSFPPFLPPFLPFYLLSFLSTTFLPFLPPFLPFSLPPTQKKQLLLLLLQTIPRPCLSLPTLSQKNTRGTVFSNTTPRQTDQMMTRRAKKWNIKQFLILTGALVASLWCSSWVCLLMAVTTICFVVW